MTDKRLTKNGSITTIQDNFIFSKTLELFPDLCKHLIEILDSKYSLHLCFHDNLNVHLI